jgi:hypothetical protein
MGTTNPLWLANSSSAAFTPSKIYEEQELTMQVSPGAENSPQRGGAQSSVKNPTYIRNINDTKQY